MAGGPWVVGLLVLLCVACSGTPKEETYSIHVVEAGDPCANAGSLQTVSWRPTAALVERFPWSLLPRGSVPQIAECFAATAWESVRMMWSAEAGGAFLSEAVTRRE
jgi:hypothetical protein